MTHTERDPRPSGQDSTSGDVIPFRQAVRAWFGISLQTFGGPAGQIAVMQRTLVEEKRWIGQQRFNHALNYCMLLPGPEAQQLAIYVGWLLNGTRGGLVAGTLFVLPGMLALLVLSAVYVLWQDTTAVTAVFVGIAPAVLAIVAQAVIRVAKRSLTHPVFVVVAIAAFSALALFGVPFPVVVAVAALVGRAVHKLAPHVLKASNGHGGDGGPAPLIPDDALHHARASRRSAGKILAVGLVAWWLPVAAVAVFLGAGSVFTTQGLFFSGTALVTFGGAYAVLAFVAQRAVETYAWLGPGEMVRGLALAESTPGPLIMVVQFVAFLGAYRDPGPLTPWAGALLGALLTTWVTFVPCFLFIFLGAPYVEKLRHNTAITAALTGITAAVVGVIANLALYFAQHTLFGRTFTWAWGPFTIRLPDPSTLSPIALTITGAALVMTFVLKWPMLRILGICALLGMGTALLP
ncbi:chromate efflux transporter [Nonomuraea sp. JJY05]|uniref:chromate efflux transporter n=1 Tax=Nonomuraea sp. JJY05 TaxID=3350255 RepID=UPI00373E3B05